MRHLLHSSYSGILYYATIINLFLHKCKHFFGFFAKKMNNYASRERTFIRNSASASVLSCRNAVVAFYIMVFRSAPFGKRVGRLSFGLRLSASTWGAGKKAKICSKPTDGVQRYVEVGFGRKKDKNNRKTKGAEGSRHMKQRFRKCFIMQKRCCCVLYYVFRSAPF